MSAVATSRGYAGATTAPRSNPIADIAAMVAREARRTVRSVDGLVSAFAIPVCIMLVFVVVFGGAIETDGKYIDYVVPGILVLCLGFGSASTATAVAQDMTSGTIDRFKTLPIFGASVLYGHVIASVLRNLAACVPVLAVAVLLGFRPHADAAGWVAAIAFSVLIIVAFTWLSCVAGLVLSIDAANSITFVFLFLPYVSSGFVATDTMPSWLQGFANNEPFTPIIETLRDLLSGVAPGDALWQACAWLVGILVASVVLSMLLYRRTVAR
ncbi:ABC transporter permease [Subtercola lobariae]|uniref:Transport permease protein n=1 Tax=Subtercola lobariae TaxID=1588641 RepID=A0A917B7J4_9MICO|nr:ABC transporter permease [Subtercola lobariae]GGF29556.1 transport permease protein [Subtercola lobariae]